MRIFNMIKIGTIQRWFKKYSVMTSLVITNHPSVAMKTVLKSIKTEDLNDFLTYCFMKKSDSAAIDIAASPEMFDILSKPKPNCPMTMKNTTNIMASKQ